MVRHHLGRDEREIITDEHCQAPQEPYDRRVQRSACIIYASDRLEPPGWNMDRPHQRDDSTVSLSVGGTNNKQPRDANKQQARYRSSDIPDVRDLQIVVYRFPIASVSDLTFSSVPHLLGSPSSRLQHCLHLHACHTSTHNTPSRTCLSPHSREEDRPRFNKWHSLLLFWLHCSSQHLVVADVCALVSCISTQHAQSTSKARKTHEAEA